MSIQIITLTSDSGLMDYYTAAVKGAIYKFIPNATILDIAHNIKPFNSENAAFQLRSCYKDFPDGTIHLMGVDAEPVVTSGSEQFPIIMEFENQYFISSDNGFFDFFLDGRVPDRLWRYEAIKDQKHLWKFAFKDCFVPLAAEIIKKTDLRTFCVPVESYRRFLRQKVRVLEESIIGKVVHVDSWGNLITDIKKSHFETFGDNKFSINYSKDKYSIHYLNDAYSQTSPGEKLAIFNSNDYLVITISRGTNETGGGAAQLFGMRVGDVVTVGFTIPGSKESLLDLI
ncbi:MAG: hypothetical protein RL264_1348 [Bacteroidota bacterium]|jgi:S-adenosylmethionine hydrolase